MNSLVNYSTFFYNSVIKLLSYNFDHTCSLSLCCVPCVSFLSLAAEKEKGLMHDEVPLGENINRLATEGDEARSVEEAINVLR